MGETSSDHEAMSTAVVQQIDHWGAGQPVSSDLFETDTYSDFQNGVDDMWETMSADTVLGLSRQQKAGSLCVTAAINGAPTAKAHEAYATALRAQASKSSTDKEKADGWFDVARTRCAEAVGALGKNEYVILVGVKPVEKPKGDTSS